MAKARIELIVGRVLLEIANIRSDAIPVLLRQLRTFSRLLSAYIHVSKERSLRTNGLYRSSGVESGLQTFPASSLVWVNNMNNMTVYRTTLRDTG